MLEVLMAAALLALGFWLGRQSRPARPQLPVPQEQEVRRLQEDRAAFAQLMGYSAERAYGDENAE